MKKTLEQLQEEHSEMLATAAELGVRVPVELTTDFTSAEVGGTVCSNLDALIRKFREGLDQSDDVAAQKNAVAVDEAMSDDAPRPPKAAAKKKSNPKAKPKKAAPPARTEAAPAKENSGEEQVAKTAKKAGKPAKKAAKPAAKKAAGKPAKKAAGFPDDATIKWGAGKKNPAREGKGRHDRIEKVIKSSGKTVKAFIASGGNPTTLRNCVSQKLCSVA